MIERKLPPRDALAGSSTTHVGVVPMPSRSPSPQRPYVVLRFNAMHGNFGDILIFHCLVHELAQRADIDIIESTPASHHHLLVRKRSALVKSLGARFSGRQVVRVDPPGALHGRPSRAKASLKDRVSEILWGLSGARRVRLGISIARGRGTDDLRGYDWIGVRDGASLGRLRGAGIQCAHLVPDLAFLLPNAARPVSPRPSALLSFRARTPEVADERAHERAVREAVPVLVRLLDERGYRCNFYSQVKEDGAFIASLAEASEEARGLAVRESARDVGRLGDDYADVAVAVSNRLHVLLAAAAFGCLPVAVVARDHEKVRDLFETAGWGALVVDLASPRLSEQLAEILDRSHELLDLVGSEFARARAAVGDGIARMLGGNP